MHLTLAKAAYVSREGSPGHYKYTYASDAGSSSASPIGKTRSDKPIHAHADHPDHASFTVADHLDAAAAHRAAADRHDGKDDAKQAHHSKQMRGHYRAMAELRTSGVAKSVAVSKADAGPGSRGGRVVGTTRSGAPIYESHSHPSHANFTAEDHQSAYVAHYNLAEKHKAALIDSLQGMDGVAGAVVGSDKSEGHFAAVEHHSEQMKLHLRSAKSGSTAKSHRTTSFSLLKGILDNTHFTFRSGDHHMNKEDQIYAHLRDVFAKASGGAGSRGGRVIGRTRSGKPVYASGNGTFKYGKADHVAASAAHEKAFKARFKAAKEATAAGKPELAHKHLEAAGAHQQLMDSHYHAANTFKSMAHAEDKTSFMHKANELDGVNFSEGAIYDAQGGQIEADPSSITELQQVIADFEAAGVGSTQGARVVELANSKDVGDGVPAEANVGPWAPDTGGNAPTLPFGQTIKVSMEKSMPLPGVGMAASAIGFFTSGGRAAQGNSRRDN